MINNSDLTPVQVDNVSHARQLKEGQLVSFASRYCPKEGVFLRIEHNPEGCLNPGDIPVLLVFRAGVFSYLSVYPSKKGKFPRNERYIFGADCFEASDLTTSQDTAEIRKYGELARRFAEARKTP